MKNSILLFLSILVSKAVIAQNPVLPLLPYPQNLEFSNGSFTVNSSTRVFIDTRDSLAKKESKRFVDQVFQVTGLILPTLSGTQAPNENCIILSTQGSFTDGPETYSLEIAPQKIEVRSGTAAGLFYGLVSLEQLFPFGGLPSTEPRALKPLVFPCLKILDYPKYAWRGMHLDVSRHFFPIGFVKRYLDYLAWCKMNVFHWHLTDSQGWRMEIKRYPKLTQVGAFRVQRPGELFSEAEPQKPGEVPNYGGFYTQQEIKEIIRYAQDRHITVLPEIDMPGHCQAALVAYPEYSSLPGPQLMPSGAKGAYLNSFNPGFDSTYSFLENILTEVMDLFPSTYIHIGGDEVDRSIWRTNPLCNERVKKENLKSEDELQAYFTRRMESFINSRGRKMIGWDEILEGGIAPRATVMSWRGNKGGIRAVKEGHEVIMAPDTFTYFDLYQGDPKQEPEAYSKLNLTTAYQFFPAPPDLTMEERKLILGGEGALWSETISDPAHAEYMLFPRLFALSESVWDIPQNKNWESFKNRLPLYLNNLQSGGVNYARSAYNVNDFPERDTAWNTVKLNLSNELNWGKIYYTMDGTNPSPSANLYSGPFLVKGNKIIKMASFENGNQISGINEEKFETSLSTSKEVILGSRPSKRFPGLSGFLLTDGIRGTDNPLDGRWLGFTGSSLLAVLDLGKVRPLNNFGMDFLNHPQIGIYLPDSLEVEISENGKKFSPLVSYSRKEIYDMKMVKRVKLYREFKNVQARFVRVKAIIPPPGPEDGGRAYILTDEIRIN